MFNASSDGHDGLDTDLPVPCPQVHPHLAIAQGHAHHGQAVGQNKESHIEPGIIGLSHHSKLLCILTHNPVLTPPGNHQARPGYKQH